MPRVRSVDETLSVRNGHLFVEDRDAAGIAREFGTPLYVMSETRLRGNARRYLAAFRAGWPHGEVRVLPSMKANFSLALGRILADEGLGCDVFGPAEFGTALQSGVAPGSISLNGSIKDQALIDAAVEAGARITLDSGAELDRVLDAARRLHRRALIRLRGRPDYRGLDMPTDFLEQPVPLSEAARRYKAGIPTSELLEIGRRALARDEVRLCGLMVHLPRHRTELEVWRAASERFADLVSEVSEAWGGWRPEELDVGGGLPTRRDPTGRLVARLSEEDRALAPTVEEYGVAIGTTLATALGRRGVDPSGIALEVEPGRGLFADAGIHLTTVRNVKHEDDPEPWTWVETDTSEMFLLDVLIEHSRWECLAVERMDEPAESTVDVVGRSCGFDLIAAEVALPGVGEGDVLAFLDTGAYQDSSATNFNAMPRPGTVLVREGSAELIKRPETVDEVLGRDVVPERLRSVSVP